MVNNNAVQTGDISFKGCGSSLSWSLTKIEYGALLREFGVTLVVEENEEIERVVYTPVLEIA